MKINTTFLKTTMVKANELQSRYNQLGASPHQSVRNPLPMHQLVLTVLPTMPSPNDIVELRHVVHTTFAGKTTTKVINEAVFAKDALPKNHWKSKALSVDEIVKTLRAKGFIVNCKGTVAMALVKARYESNLQSVKEDSNGLIGKPINLYFVAQ